MRLKQYVAKGPEITALQEKPFWLRIALSARCAAANVFCGNNDGYTSSPRTSQLKTDRRTSAVVQRVEISRAYFANQLIASRRQIGDDDASLSGCCSTERIPAAARHRTCQLVTIIGASTDERRPPGPHIRSFDERLLRPPSTLHENLVLIRRATTTRNDDDDGDDNDDEYPSSNLVSHFDVFRCGRCI